MEDHSSSRDHAPSITAVTSAIESGDPKRALMFRVQNMIDRERAAIAKAEAS